MKKYARFLLLESFGTDVLPTVAVLDVAALPCM